MGPSDGRERVGFGLSSFEPKGTPRMRRIVDQAPVAAALDYDNTVIGALELSAIGCLKSGPRYSKKMRWPIGCGSILAGGFIRRSDTSA